MLSILVYLESRWAYSVVVRLELSYKKSCRNRFLTILNMLVIGIFDILKWITNIISISLQIGILLLHPTHFMPVMGKGV